MELKVWLEDLPRIVCGVTKHTTAEEVCRALAVATGQMGRFVLVERRSGSAVGQRRLRRDDKPLKILEQWGEFANDIYFTLLRTDDLRRAPKSNRLHASRDSEKSYPSGTFSIDSSPTTETGDASQPLAETRTINTSSCASSPGSMHHETDFHRGAVMPRSSSTKTHKLKKSAVACDANASPIGALSNSSPLLSSSSSPLNSYTENRSLAAVNGRLSRKIKNNIIPSLSAGDKLCDKADGAMFTDEHIEADNNSDNLHRYDAADAVVDRVVHGEELEMKRQFLIAQISAMHSELDALDERTGKCNIEILNWHKQIGKQEQMLTQLQQQVATLEKPTAAAVNATASSSGASTLEKNQNDAVYSTMPSIVASTTTSNNLAAATSAEFDALSNVYRRLLALNSETERLYDEHRHACDVAETDISNRLFDAEKLTLEYHDTLTAELAAEQKQLVVLEKHLRRANLQAFLNGKNSIDADEQQNSAEILNDDADTIENYAAEKLEVAGAADEEATEEHLEPPAPPVTFAGDHGQFLALDGAVPTPTAVHSVKKRQQHGANNTSHAVDGELRATSNKDGVVIAVSEKPTQRLTNATTQRTQPRVVMLKRNPARNPEGLWV